MERRALIVGVNYIGGAQNELQGCINDAVFMSGRLQQSGFAITTLRDDDDARMPTARRILCEFYDLVRWANAGHSREIAFHFSGHGVGLPDTSGDETDGRDECMVGCDSAVIRDDDMRTLLAMLPAHAKATLVIDCCHSGTMVDLPNRLGYVRSPHARTIAADVMMLSGCMDAQTSADTIDLRPQYQCYSGAMTSALLFCLEYAKNWGELVRLMRFVLRRRGFRQVPQLSASFHLDGSEPLSAFAACSAAAKPTDHAPNGASDSASTWACQLI